MESDNPQARSYLQELFSATSGDPEVEVSMHDIGIAIGLEKSDSGALAEQLIVEGLVELRSLSGGVSITVDGMKAIDMEAAGIGGDEVARLGNDRVLSEDLRTVVERVIDEVQREISSQKLSYDQLESLVIDIKTIQVQLLSPYPATAIVREVLRSMADGLSKCPGSEMAATRIEKMIN